MHILSIILAALVLGGSNPSLEKTTDKSPAFCRAGTLVRDFGLAKLPKTHQPPRSGKLPFGPKAVTLTGPRDPVLRLGEPFGYQLLSENYRGETPLHWTLTARMVSVNATGQTTRVLGDKTIRVRAISADDQPTLFLTPPKRSGFFQYELLISGRRGEKLARYRRYVKVIRQSWKVRLHLDRQEIEPGQTLISRVENLGSGKPYFGEAFAVQRRAEGRWNDDPELTPEEWLAWLGTAAPGEAGRCSYLKLPDDLSAGTYRIVKVVRKGLGPPSRQPAELKAPFEVLAGSPGLKQK